MSLCTQLDLYVFALSGEARRDVLIPYTEIPVVESMAVEGKKLYGPLIIATTLHLRLGYCKGWT